MYTKSIDISTYQDSPSIPGHINFSHLKSSHDIKLIINRATFSNSPDDDFLLNWQLEKENHFIRGAYGFWDYRPGNPGVAAQANCLVKTLSLDPGEFPIVWMDLERPVSTWPQLPPPRIVLQSMKQYGTIVESGLPGKTIGWYMNGGMIKYLMSDYMAWTEYKDYITSKSLWIAAWPDWSNSSNTGIYKALPNETLEQWIERVQWKPNLYGQWNEWLLWQYGTPVYGLDYGLESKEVDADFYHGAEDELYDFCGLDEDDEPDPPEPPIDNGDNKMLKMRVVVPILNIRSGPSIISNKIGSLSQGTIVTVYDVRGISGAWINISPTNQEWICVQNSGGTYLMKEVIE